MNPLKKKISEGSPVVGSWSIIDSPSMSEVCGAAGLDFLILDLEHGVFDLPLLQNCIRACEARGCSPLVRIQKAGDKKIQNILDMGAHGIVVPQILDLEMAQEAVSALRYPPRGTRGYNPFTRSGAFSGKTSLTESDDFSFNTLLIENPKTFEQLDEILEIPGLDAIYLGTYDMSLALGCPGEMQNPELIRFVETSIQKAVAHKKSVGVMFKTQEELKRYRDLGANLFVYGVDSWVYMNAMAQGKVWIEELGR